MHISSQGKVQIACSGKRDLGGSKSFVLREHQIQCITNSYLNWIRKLSSLSHLHYNSKLEQVSY